MSFILSKPTIRVNNEVIGIKPNSCKMGTGDGETEVLTSSLGGDEYDIVISDNAEDKLGPVSFAMHATIEAYDQARAWKKNPGVNVVEVSGETPDGKKLSAVYRKQSITNPVEMNFVSGGDTTLDWKGLQPT